MPIYSIFRMKNHALLMALSAAYPVIGYTAGAAQIDFATGAVTGGQQFRRSASPGQGGRDQQWRYDPHRRRWSCAGSIQ